MKNFRITLLTFCILGSFAVQAQNPYWATYSLKKFDLSNNTVSNLPGGNSTCNVGNITANAQGLFDAAGNPVFYVQHDKIYDRNGQIKFSIPNAYFCVKGLHIVPVPNGGCGEYYVIYVRQVTLNPGPGNFNPNAYEVGAIRVTVGANQNITVSNNIHKVTYADGSFVLTSSHGIGTALSKENDQERILYVGFRRSFAFPSKDQLVSIRVTSAGLAKAGGFGVYPSVTTVRGHTLELSPDQNYLAWLDSAPGGDRIAVMNLSDSTQQMIQVSGLDERSEIEFGANSDDIYVTTTQGVVKTSRSNPQVVSGPIAGTGPMHYQGNVELGGNNQLYVTATNGQLYVIDLNAQIPTANSIANNFPLTLPEQVDGETIVYAPLTISLNILITEQVQVNVTGGSGNYSYTWSDPLGNTQTGNPVRLRGKGTYTLTVTDNVSGCTSTIQYTNQPSLVRSRHSTSSNVEFHNIGIKAYPNPTDDYLNIQVGHNEKIVQLQVMDFQGRVLNQWDGNQKAIQHIATNSLEQGSYLLIVVTDKLRHQIKFLVR